jgi:hypothetical protein
MAAAPSFARKRVPAPALKISRGPCARCSLKIFARIALCKYLGKMPAGRVREPGATEVSKRAREQSWADTTRKKPRDRIGATLDGYVGGRFGARGAEYGKKGAGHGKKGAEHGEKGAEHGEKGAKHGEKGAEYGKKGAEHGKRGIGPHNAQGAKYGAKGSEHGVKGLGPHNAQGAEHGVKGAGYGKLGAAYGRKGGRPRKTPR